MSTPLTQDQIDAMVTAQIDRALKIVQINNWAGMIPLEAIIQSIAIADAADVIATVLEDLAAAGLHRPNLRQR